MIITEILQQKTNNVKFCVYQGQGACEILESPTQDKYKGFIYLRNMNNLKILVPAQGEALSRFRKIISKEEAQFLLKDQLEEKENTKKYANWNRKYRYYMSIIQENDALKICEIIQEFNFEKQRRELNFSEKKLNEHCLFLLNEEIKLALKLS